MTVVLEGLSEKYKMALSHAGRGGRSRWGGACAGMALAWLQHCNGTLRPPWIGRQFSALGGNAVAALQGSLLRIAFQNGAS